MVICRPLITLCSCDMWNNQFTARNTALQTTLILQSISSTWGLFSPFLSSSNSLGHNPDTRASITDPLTSLQGKSVNINYLGFRKVFNTVTPSILLDKISRIFWTKYPAREIHNTMGEQQAQGSDTKGYSKWGYIRLATTH